MRILTQSVIKCDRIPPDIAGAALRLAALQQAETGVFAGT